MYLFAKLNYPWRSRVDKNMAKPERKSEIEGAWNILKEESVKLCLDLYFSSISIKDLC